ncbi:MAG TPA: alpha/beta fold hydrolase, partial [Opitutaceae bacterium]|nr:alpha/beta fold hydrolase [Opitutaceae bacterium]
LAAMGYAVLQVNHRGCEGFGTAHRTAFQDSFDRVAAEDIVACIDWISARENINPKLAAVFGVGFGGYFALRAMELFPDRFRCGMVVNPQTDLAMLLAYTPDGQTMRGDVYRAVFGKDTKRLDAISAVKQAAALTQPLLIVRNKMREEAPADVLRSALSRLGRKPEVLEVGDEFLRGPEATAKAFEQIEGFLNLNVYRFGADAGETKVVE